MGGGSRRTAINVNPAWGKEFRDFLAENSLKNKGLNPTKPLKPRQLTAPHSSTD
jgi:hypothetical protein